MKNREIKFRAWDAQENKMNHNGCLGAGSGSQLLILEWQGGISFCNAYGLPDGSNPTFDKPLTERFNVMQFTGLHDKNGKEIYEGDILKFKQYVGGNFVEFKFETLYVVWDELSAGFNFRNISNVGGRKPFSSHEGYELEVIGNIYQNPELI